MQCADFAMSYWRENRMCKFCKAKIFVQFERATLPALAPATEVAQLEYELINKTGLEYVQIPNKYCPMCGKKLGV